MFSLSLTFTYAVLFIESNITISHASPRKDTLLLYIHSAWNQPQSRVRSEETANIKLSITAPTLIILTEAFASITMLVMCPYNKTFRSINIAAE